jgi:hypothetical protein
MSTGELAYTVSTLLRGAVDTVYAFRRQVRLTLSIHSMYIRTRTW